MVTKRKWIFYRIMSIALVVSVMFTSNSIVAMAENIQITEQESSVIEISSAKDLQKGKDDLTKDYVLTEDSEMSDVGDVPDRNNKELFTGEVAGNGNIISSLANLEMLRESADVKEDSDDGIMLLASDELISGDFIYSVNENNATITGYTGSSESVVIPSKIEEYTVTAIGNEAFSGKEVITAISLPNTITYLGYRFIQGTGIKSITIPKNVTKCGTQYVYDGPLAGSSVTEVVFDEGMKKIPYGACSIGRYIEKVIIPEGVTEIDSYAFCGCEKITSVNLPKTVSIIRSRAFANCTALSNLILPESLTCLESYILDSRRTHNEVGTSTPRVSYI